MSVALDLELNLGLLVGEMPAPPCESPHHGDGTEHEGDGAFYARTGHACYGPVNSLFVICEQYAKYWTDASRNAIHCAWCFSTIGEYEHVAVIGPIGTL